MNNQVRKPGVLHAYTSQLVAFGADDLDHVLEGGLSRGRLHEFYAAVEADCVAATALGLGLSHRAAKDSPVFWIRTALASAEAGQPYGAGLAMFGLQPSQFVLVAVKDTEMALKAALDVARGGSSPACVLELWGEHRMLTLTASRRLFLAAKDSGLTLFMLRTGARVAASAAETRWQVRSLASRALAANAPGHPRFELTLMRHRGLAGDRVQRSWSVEWNREQRCFAESASLAPALSQPVVSLSSNRPAVAPARDLRRTG
jgi:protein ImuA